MNKKKNLEIATTIETFGREHELLTDTRIYFNGMAWAYDSYGKKTVIQDIKGSEFTEYANDEMVTVTTEGGLYHVINHYSGFDLDEELTVLLEKKHDVFYELGNAWNFSVYKR